MTYSDKVNVSARFASFFTLLYSFFNSNTLVEWEMEVGTYLEMLEKHA